MIKLIVCLLITIFVSSCSSKSIIPNLTIGSEEHVWTDTLKTMLKRGDLEILNLNDSLSFKYNFILNLKEYPVYLKINKDGIYKENLRIISATFINSLEPIHPDPNSTTQNYPTVSQDSVITEKLRNEGALVTLNSAGRITDITHTFLPKQTFTDLYNSVSQYWGKPDSILDRHDNRLDTITNRPTKKVKKTSQNNDFNIEIIDRSEIDSSIVRYYFHDKRSIIVIERKQFFEPNYYIPIEHFSKLKIYQYLKDFNKEIKLAEAKIQKKLKPADIISFPLNYEVENKIVDYGLEQTILNIWVDLTPRLRKTYVETRDIKSLKGKIIIKDNYNSIIESVPDVDIEANGSLPSLGSASLNTALSDFSLLDYEPIRYKFTLFVDYKGFSDSFRVAVKSNRQMKLEFIPEAILFTDGSVLSN